MTPLPTPARLFKSADVNRFSGNWNSYSCSSIMGATRTFRQLCYSIILFIHLCKASFLPRKLLAQTGKFLAAQASCAFRQASCRASFLRRTASFLPRKLLAKSGKFLAVQASCRIRQFFCTYLVFKDIFSDKFYFWADIQAPISAIFRFTAIISFYWEFIMIFDRAFFWNKNV